jgi:hypothetical protein
VALAVLALIAFWRFGLNPVLAALVEGCPGLLRLLV